MEKRNLLIIKGAILNMLDKFTGNIVYAMARFLEISLNIIINIADFIVGFVRSIARGFAAILGMGGCLLIIFLMSPVGLMILFNPLTLLLILFLIVFPILGTKFISFLKYIKYTTTEYLYDRADFLISGKKEQFKSFNEYGNKYKRMEEEKERAEREKRRAQEQKEWEERFRQWSQYQNFGGGNSSGGQWNAGGYGGNTYVNPSIAFKEKYEKSTQLLGVPTDADKYQIKLAYRQKAKKFHPDINKEADATQKFQEINDAYDFLSDEHIERYKSMN